MSDAVPVEGIQKQKLEFYNERRDLIAIRKGLQAETKHQKAGKAMRELFHYTPRRRLGEEEMY
jgi:hypothetical protein